VARELSLNVNSVYKAKEQVTQSLRKSWRLVEQGLNKSISGFRRRSFHAGQAWRIRLKTAHRRGLIWLCID
jgi:hypothetical protein